MFALSIGWVRWNTRRVFFANVAADAPACSQRLADVWTTLTRDQQMVLLQVAHERIANPYQRPIVDSLLETGLLLAPDLGPPAEATVVALASFLVATQPGLQTSLLAIATGITGVLTTVLKTRHAIASWFAARKGSENSARAAPAPATMNPIRLYEWLVSFRDFR